MTILPPLGNTPDDGAVAVLPKDKRTSAAVELFDFNGVYYWILI
jgi:hypothetical protein